MRKISRIEEVEEKQLERTRRAQRNYLGLAANPESPEKLALTLKEESSAIEADKQELVFVRSEYKEGLERLRKQRQRVDGDRAALIGKGLR